MAQTKSFPINAKLSGTTHTYGSISTPTIEKHMQLVLKIGAIGTGKNKKYAEMQVSVNGVETPALPNDDHFTADYFRFSVKAGDIVGIAILDMEGKQVDALAINVTASTMCVDASQQTYHAMNKEINLTTSCQRPASKRH